MESRQVAKSPATRGLHDDLKDAQLDLKDACYTVPVHHKHRRYLRFIFQCEFRSLPFGLSSASRAFTKMLKPVAALLRSQGVRVVLYLDDILILQNLGFTVKREKCSAQLCAITTIAKEVLKFQETSFQMLLTLLGRMNHASQTGLLLAPLYYRSLQRDHIEAMHSSTNPSQSLKIALSPTSLEELRWWVSPITQNFNGQPLQTPPIEMTVSTDTSLLGWGATWPETTIGGPWLPLEAQAHINLLELKVTYLALSALFKSSTPVPQHVLLQMDNSTAVAYVNKRGDTITHLIDATTDLLAVVLSAGSWITAKHIPGTSNEIVDTASRDFNNHFE